MGGLAADSLGARQVGSLMFPIAQAHVAAAVLVPDAAIAAAQRRSGTVAPGRRTGRRHCAGSTVVRSVHAARRCRVGVLVCGANTDPAKVAGHDSRPLSAGHR